MSERQNLHGKNAPPHVIECDGKTYTIPAAFDVGDLLDIEKTLYARAIESLAMQKGAMDREQYGEKLDALRAKYDKGDYSFENEETQAILGTPKGGILFLKHILKASDAELMRLFQLKGQELASIMQSLTKATFPDTPEPTAGASDPKA